MKDSKDPSGDEKDLREKLLVTTKERENARYAKSMDICFRIVHNQFITYVTKQDM